MLLSGSSLAAVVAAFAFAALLTPIVRLIARRVRAVAQPKPDRWHRKPTAMFGGVAIYLAVALSYFMFMPHDRGLRVVIGCSTLLFILGAIDDIFHIKPHQKLIGQVLGAALPVYFGLTLPWTSSQVVNMAITIFWLIGITNSVNLLDNMDGLAAGIAAIASLCLGANFMFNGQMTEAVVLAVLAASLIGFLIYNSNPASIFMGDSGSLFIGFLLASTALLSSAGAAGRSRSLLSVLAAPVLIFVIPIFDTTFVALLRRMSGRAISQGGRDHTSHRLVALGLSERRAVWMLYAFAASSGALALLVRNQQLDVSIAAISAYCVGLTLIGVYLAAVKVYDPTDEKAPRLASFLIDLSYKRRIFEVMLDVVLILLAYYTSYAVLFGPMKESNDWNLFLHSAPLVVFAKMAAFLALGVYRGLWRYTGLRDLLMYARAVFAGTAAAVLIVLFVFRFQGFSRTAFIIDGLLLLMFVSMSRVAFRLFRTLLPIRRDLSAKRILIYGAGDAGELLLRELNNNSDLAYTPVGFIDDDGRKTGKLLHGLRIHEAAQVDLHRLIDHERVDEIVISSMKVPLIRLRQLIERCPPRFPVKRMRIDFIDVTRESLMSDVNVETTAAETSVAHVTGS